MEIMYVMDRLLSTTSRGWTEITPKYTVFTPLAQFEVRRQIFDKDLFDVCKVILVAGLKNEKAA